MAAPAPEVWEGKKYELESSDNFDEYMRELGVGWFLRRAGNNTYPTVSLTKDGNIYTLKTESTFKTTQISFELGKEFDEETLDGRNVKSVMTLDGNTLTQEQGGDKPSTIVRVFGPTQMVATITVGNAALVNGRNREKCYKCNQIGHFARECKEDADRCYRCNGTGHIARYCSQSPDEPSCYTCNRTGHVARNCPDAPSRGSGGGSGGGGGGGGGGGDSDRGSDRDRGGRDNDRSMSCYTCNKSGHISRNCPDGAKSCYNCGDKGHLSRECTQNGGRN